MNEGILNFSCLMMILLSILKKVNGEICYYYTDNLKNVTSSTSCSVCCEAISSSFDNVCCSRFTSPSFLWAIPFVILIGCCLVLAAISGVYALCCSKKRRTASEDPSVTESETQSRLDLDRLPSLNMGTSSRSTRSARHSTNSEIKPQRIDVMALPSYSEASKMRSESPPNYLDLYGNARNSQQINL